MPGMTERHPSHGPVMTYRPWTSVIGGRLVEPDTTNVQTVRGEPIFVKHASEGSTTVLGMARYDAAKRQNGSFGLTAGPANTGLVVNSNVPEDVACPDHGVYDVEVTAAAPMGCRFVAGAEGKFKPVAADGSTTGVRVAKNVGPALNSADVTAGKRARVMLLSL